MRPTLFDFETLRSSGNPIREVRRFLRHAGRLDTLKHAAQVNTVGRRLARRCGGFDLGAVDLACTAHDLAAVVPLFEIITVAEKMGVALIDADRAIPQTVHGLVAATLLQQRLAVTDVAVLNAVRYHTTLRAGATPLEQLVFIADKIALDPTARHAGFHADLLAAQEAASLAELCGIYLKWVMCEGPGLGWKLHPHLVAAWKDVKRDA